MTAFGLGSERQELDGIWYFDIMFKKVAARQGDSVLNERFREKLMRPDQPIHVMHIVRTGLAEGGMENGIVNIAERLPARFQVCLCALDSQETFSSRIRRPGSSFHLLPKNGQGIDYSLIFRLSALAQKLKVNVLHSHNWGTFIYAVGASWLSGIPLVHGEHGRNPNELGAEPQRKTLIKKILGRRPCRILAVSDTLADELKKYQFPPNKVQCIPNGVDTARFSPQNDRSKFRERFGLPQEAFILGVIGRLDEIKNQELLLKTLAQLALQTPLLQVALLGRGPDEAKLRSLCKDLAINDRVHFLGHRTNPEDFLRSIDVFVSCSKYEGMSNVLLEAMASGLPVICSGIESHVAMLHDGLNGLLFSPLTVEALAAKIIALMLEPTRRKELGMEARQTVLRKYSLDKMVEAYAAVYGECADSSRSHAV